MTSLEDDIRRKTAHHEAGHAVAAVSRGGQLVGFWFTPLGQKVSKEAKHGATLYTGQEMHEPFVTFAGPWAQAKWFTETGEFDSFWDELGYAWDENSGHAGSADIDGVAVSVRSDADSYEHAIKQLSGVPSWPELSYDNAPTGYTKAGRYWEARWNDELTELWPAICKVADLLLAGTEVSHEAIVKMIEPARL